MMTIAGSGSATEPLPALFRRRPALYGITRFKGNTFQRDNYLTTPKFSDFGLAEPIQRALEARHHVDPTPIQAQTIPKLLAGKDLMGIAQTGTGKTAAFALPILHRLAQTPVSRPPARKGRQTRALILSPTRELAIQIGEEFRAYGRHLSLRNTIIYGGVSQRPQVRALSRGVDIVVATPGRLLDLMGQGQLALGAVQHLVLDEADRMLDMGFIPDVRKIIAAVPCRRQSMMFSATMPAEVAGLSGEILADPARVAVAPQATPVERIQQSLHHVEANAKATLLTRILDDPALSRVLVFARTKHRANRVAEKLGKGGISAEAIHGNKSQGARQRALQRFRDGDARVLVATDIAARGLDVAGISHVINYELPNEPENYVHRIGRTARAGASGTAVSFCDVTERSYLNGIERLIGHRLTVVGDKPVNVTSEGLAKRRSRPTRPWHRSGDSLAGNAKRTFSPRSRLARP